MPTVSAGLARQDVGEPALRPRCPPEMRIRLATSDDAHAICRLVRPLLERFVAHEFSERGRETLLAHCTPGAMGQRLRENYRYHLAESDGELIGSVGVRDDRHLFHLFVAESHHRRGVGRALWQTAKAAAEPGNAGAGFTVNSSRFAVPFYGELGFIETGPPEDREGVVSIPMRCDG